jgi:hypothetical protein
MDESPGGIAALRSYERAGFLKIDPRSVPYWQPDFRAPEEIDRTGLQPVPYALVVRRVDRESERSITGREVHTLVSALYTMFGVHFRADHMAPLWSRLDSLPSEDDTIELQAPARK